MFSKRRRILNSKHDCYQNSFFQTSQRLISSTCRVLIIRISSRNRHFSSRKTKLNKWSDVVNRTMHQNSTTYLIAFSKVLSIRMSHLINLFRVCTTLNYHSRCFRETHIITLKKFDKKNYTNIKTYRSIVLLNTFDKTFESIIARRINDLTKAHDFLFVNLMKERKNRSCETILKLFTKQILIVWNTSKNTITTLLSMNVIDAYDHVFRDRLLHNLRKRRIFVWIIAWTNNFMQNRRINSSVKIDQTIMSSVNVDISQKSSMSSILYLFYDANLLKLLD
jgi:hypothetical protein